ncbi:exopolyphosphatase [Vibrio quintilis]|uniref:Exopolyphosphatase n=1 Tax=Vibrio quintilis TaxID=1117707 RepID=A0A1M7YZY0_9VIBR|nr:exopolyphosphatase [Vibrio quintilis]SHO58123.1 Exopolyphosphatase [Vibrio quintilis]
MKDVEEIRHIAAIDLGSNSFHMVVAKVVNQDLQLISRHKQRVRLATGLNDQKVLDQTAIQRGIECLEMFAERIQGFSPENVRITATHTLRQAKNTAEFIEQARQVIPYPVEVIPGAEEARLIYLGVAHTQPQSQSMLVIDIGGGSTELVIGHEFTPELVNSLQIGCVSYTNRFFPDGKITRKRLNQAILAAEQKLESIVRQYRKKGWDTAFGSSGTIKAVRDVLSESGAQDGSITLSRLEKLQDKLVEAGSVDNLSLKGLSEERKPVFVAGVAILFAIIKDLKIREMHFSQGALREGLLYEMEDRLKYTDIRLRTAESLAQKHQVDIDHARKVKKLAKQFLEQLAPVLELPAKNTELFDLLEWSAILHEVGLSINLQGFHRHSAYILRHTNMPGFNSEQQELLSTLVRFHRKALKLNEMPELTLYKKKHVIQIIRILRLAVVLNGQRSDDPLPELKIIINDHDKWTLNSVEQEWLENNKLLHTDLETEQQYWQSAGWTLQYA